MRQEFRSKQKLLSVNIIVSALFSYCAFFLMLFFRVRFFPVRFFPVRFFPETISCFQQMYINRNHYVLANFNQIIEFGIVINNFNKSRNSHEFAV